MKKISPKRVKNIFGSLREIEEKIYTLEFSESHLSFRSKYGIPLDPEKGLIEGDWNRDSWFFNLNFDKEKLTSYKTDLNGIMQYFGFEKAELDSLEDWLQMGDPIVLVNRLERIKLINNSETGENEVWLRVDGLSSSEILERIKEIEDEKNGIIKVDNLGKPGRLKEIALHRRIFKMRQSGLNSSKISDILTQRKYLFSDSPDEDFSPDNVRQIVRRYKKTMKDNLAKCDKLKFKK